MVGGPLSVVPNNLSTDGAERLTNPIEIVVVPVNNHSRELPNGHCVGPTHLVAYLGFQRIIANRTSGWQFERNVVVLDRLIGIDEAVACAQDEPSLLRRSRVRKPRRDGVTEVCLLGRHKARSGRRAHTPDLPPAALNDVQHSILCSLRCR